MSNGSEPTRVQSTKTGDGTIIEWDDSEMESSYANISNVASTREEVSVFFGTNETWKAGEKIVRVKLKHRIVMNPFAAKRLHLLLSNILAEHEKRFGEVRLDPVAAKGGKAAKSAKGANGEPAKKA